MTEIKFSSLAALSISSPRVKEFLGRPESPALIFLLTLLLAFSATTNGFCVMNNFLAIIEQAVIISIVGLAVNQVILTAEIDVSVGSILAVCAFTFGNLSLSYGGLIVPLAGSIAFGAMIGSVNGFLTAYGRVPSIIATLGTLFIFRGLILTVAGAQVISVPAESRILGQAKLGSLPVSILLLGVLIIAIRWISRNTSWGINVYAVGGNERGANTLGLPASSTRFWAFVLSGAFCGLAAAVFLGQIGQLQATAATAFELKVITAVVIGGTSIRGGRGSVYSPIIGALLVGVILNAMTLNRVPGTMELLVLGSLILMSITFDGFRQRYLEKRV